MFLYEPDEASWIWPDGAYPARVLRVEEKTSKKGNPMLEVHLEVRHGKKKKVLKDYIARPGGIWKLKELADALGAREEFEKKVFDLEGYVGRPVDVAIVTRDSQEFGERNYIDEYKEPSTKGPEEVDHDVPF